MKSFSSVYYTLSVADLRAISQLTAELQHLYDNTEVPTNYADEQPTNGILDIISDAIRALDTLVEYDGMGYITEDGRSYWEYEDEDSDSDSDEDDAVQITFDIVDDGDDEDDPWSNEPGTDNFDYDDDDDDNDDDDDF